MVTGRFLIRRRDRNVDDISIESDGLTIGRLPGNELVLNNRAVDDTCAGIKEIDGHYWIFNLSSGNGIVLNRALVERAELRDNDVLQAGPYLLRFGIAGGELTITVEVGAGWQVEDGPAVAAVTNLPDAQSLNVFWDKRKRESGKITDDTMLSPRGKRRLGKALTCWRPTLDLRQPWRPAFFIWGGAAVALFGLTALAAWHGAYSPGELASPHRAASVATHAVATRALGGSCSGCHSPLRTMDAQCLDCHRVAGLGEAISDAHRKAGMNCASCHKEHRGSDPRAGLASAGVCVDCHTDRGPIREGTRAGATLGLPHPTTHGYPVVDGAWRWKGLGLAEWKARGLPEYLASRPVAEQFHAVHRAVHMPMATKNRMECGVCHGEGVPKKEDRPLALVQSCDACHASTGERAASTSGCVSCHPPHGSTLEARALFAGLNGDFRRLPEAERAQAARTPPPPLPQHEARVGAFSLAGWTGIFFLPVVISLVALSLRTSRLRSSIAAIEAEPKAAETVTSRSEGPGYPHPVIDPILCIGCHACVDACPHDVIAIVNGVATPIALDQCMEDTACMAECPTSPKACVVVNTAKKIPPRKVPRRNQNYMTDVPGIYIVGDVSGVPLVKNALNEGTQVMQYVVEDLEHEEPAAGVEYDVGIIGTGPAGFSAAVTARDQGLSCIAFEANRIANTIRTYPAGKYVFFKPDTVSVKGSVPLPGVGGKKEELLRLWDELAAGVNIRELERCTGIRPITGGFEITTLVEAGQEQHVTTARRIVLAIGNLGSPMKLGVAGEDMKIPLGPDGTLVPKVKYNLADPSEHVGRKCIVVGAGNSAIEAAVDLTGFQRQGSEFVFTRTNQVTLVVRSDFKGDLKLGNKMNIFDCMDAGRIKVYFRTAIKEISEGEVVLGEARSGAETARLANDFIFALIGSERPTKFLQSLGVQIEGDKRPPK